MPFLKFSSPLPSLTAIVYSKLVISAVGGFGAIGTGQGPGCGTVIGVGLIGTGQVTGCGTVIGVG